MRPQLRFAVLGGLFGTTVALLAVGGRSRADWEWHDNHKCHLQVSCSDFEFENVPACPPGALCTSTNQDEFRTCRPSTKSPKCFNDRALQGYVGCGGLCSTGLSFCQYEINKCSPNQHME